MYKISSLAFAKLKNALPCKINVDSFDSDNNNDNVQRSNFSITIIIDNYYYYVHRAGYWGSSRPQPYFPVDFNILCY